MVTEDGARNGPEATEATEADRSEAPCAEPSASAPNGEVLDEGEVPLDELTGELAEPLADAVERLRSERDELTERSAKLRDQLLRTAADFDNFRKRAAKQEESAATRAVEETLRAVLPTIDNLERAIVHAREYDPDGKVIEGLQLVVRGFTDAFAARKLERLESVGKPFDPSRHEAISQMETVEHPAGTVAQEYQAGWLLGDRLLRPALVVVARPPRPAPVETPAAAGAEDAGAAPPAAEPEAPGDGSDAEGGGN